MKKNKVSSLLIIIMIILGIALFFYPIVSNWLFMHRSVSKITAYDNDVGNLSLKIRTEEWEKARAYNNSLNKTTIDEPLVSDINTVPGSGISPPANYYDLLNIGGQGMMGVIEIPKIKVNLPIYHGISDEVLEKGVGHIQGTSLPIGGNGTHSFLTAHTGLHSAKLFSDLDKLVIDDIFTIRIMNEKLTYQVKYITVVPAYTAFEFSAEKDKDYVTLITCTPKGINSHRLLVQGTRIFPQNEFENIETDCPICPLIWIIIIDILLLSAITIYRRARRRKAHSR